MIFRFSELDSVYLPIYIKPFNSQTMLQRVFKVDTGSDACTISKEDLQILGYNTLWIAENIVEKGIATLANKTTIEVGIIQIPLLNLLSYECKYWPFTITINEDTDFKNLLGRDLLAGFDYTFSNTEKIFEIEKAKRFVYIKERLRGQSIDDLEQKTK